MSSIKGNGVVDGTKQQPLPHYLEQLQFMKVERKTTDCFQASSLKRLIQTEMTPQLSESILSGLSALALVLVFLHLWRDSVKRTHPESPYKDIDSRRVGACVNSQTSVYRQTSLQSCSNKSKTGWCYRCVGSATTRIETAAINSGFLSVFERQN